MEVSYSVVVKSEEALNLKSLTANKYKGHPMGWTLAFSCNK
jgi:hypothetical protein